MVYAQAKRVESDIGPVQSGSLAPGEHKANKGVFITLRIHIRSSQLLQHSRIVLTTGNSQSL
jgi:hypothetical protein